MGSTAASTSQNSRTAPPTPSSTSWSALQVCEALLHVFLRVPCWLAISRLTLAAAACTARDIAGLQPLATQPVIDALSATWAQYDTERRHLKSLKVQAVDSVAVVGGTFLLDAEIQDVDLSLPEARAHGGGLHHVRCAQQCADSALMGGWRCTGVSSGATQNSRVPLPQQACAGFLPVPQGLAAHAAQCSTMTPPAQPALRRRGSRARCAMRALSAASSRTRTQGRSSATWRTGVAMSGILPASCRQSCLPRSWTALGGLYT